MGGGEIVEDILRRSTGPSPQLEEYYTLSSQKQDSVVVLNFDQTIRSVMMAM
jgi:hypothetical protein